MGKRRQVLPDDVEQLLDLIQKGKLFAVQDWIKAGKRIRIAGAVGKRVEVLTQAIATGFHSLIEELLRAGGWSQEELSEALDLARARKRYDIADLLLQYGAQPKQLDFQTCCQELDLSMMERHLRSGTDPNKNNDFAKALSRVKARPLLGFYRQFRSEFPALDDQAALALSEAIQNNQVRWSALLAWAGADPFRRVPSDLDSPFPVSPEDSTTAANEAIWRNNPEILKVLHLKPNPAQALELLTIAVHKVNVQLIRTLLEGIPRAQLNNPPRNSCAALEELVNRSPRENCWSQAPADQNNANNLKCIEMLLDAGAKWNPEPESVNYHRRWILKHDGRYLVQLVRLLLYTPGATMPENVFELCRSQHIAGKIAEADPLLANELKALRRTGRTANAEDAAAKTETVPDGQDIQRA